MGARFTLVLLGLNVVLFSLIFLLDRRQAADNAYRENTRQVFGQETTDIDYLKIEPGDGGGSRLFHRSGEEWEIREPIEWPANRYALQRIVQDLEHLERETSFRVSDLKRTGHDLDSYGLEEPRLSLTFGRDEQRHTVRVGSATDLGNRIYILDPTEEWIHVVPRDFASTLSTPLRDLRSETVFHIPLYEARSLNIRMGNQTRIRLSRDNDGWAFETPFQTRADSDAVESSINRLNGLRIDDFLDPSARPDAHGLSNPSMQITLDGNARRETLLVGDTVSGDAEDEERVYAKLADNPTLFTLPAGPLHALEQAQVLLRHRKLVDVNRGELTSINLSMPGRPDVLLQKLETQRWQVVSRFPDQSVRILPADGNLIDRLIETLDQTYITRFENDAPSDADLARYGFGDPQRVVSIDDGDGSRTILIGHHVVESQGNEVYVKLEDSRFVYTVDISFLRELPVSTQYYRDRQLLRQPDGAIISGITIRDTESDEILFEAQLPSSDANWEEALAGEPEQQRAAVLSLLPQIRDLRVQRYVHDGFAQTVQINGREVSFRYRLEAKLLLPGGDSPQESILEIKLTDRVGGTTVLAGSSDLNVVFAARDDLIEAMERLAFDRPAVEENTSDEVAEETGSESAEEDEAESDETGEGNSDA